MDGKVDYQEFVQATIDHTAVLNQQNIEIVFKMIDFDKDGRISVDELKRAFASKQNDDVIQDIMLEVDKDNDNFISSQEFNEAITSIMKKEFK